MSGGTETKLGIPDGKSKLQCSEKITISRRIDCFLAQCAARRAMGFVLGDAHAGETLALKKHARIRHEQNFYVEFPPSGDAQALVKRVSQTLHCGAHDCFDNPPPKIFAALDPSKTLIVDQIQRAFSVHRNGNFAQCLEVLCHIRNQTRCGLVVCGDGVLRDQARAAEFAIFLRQSSRHGRCLILQLP